MEQSLNSKKEVPHEDSELLSQLVIYDGREIPLSELASMDLFENQEKSNWLQELTAEKKFKFIIKKSYHNFDDKHYIERYLKLNFTVSKTESQILAYNAKIIILSSKAGMGKSTLLPSLCNKIRKLDPSSWTEIIKLTDHVQDLHLYETYPADSIDFLSKIILKHDSFSSQLFKHQLKEKKNAVIMLDAFDEISKENRQIMISIIKKLSETDVRQIWITTRPYKQFLEWQLSVRAWKLVKFSEEDQLAVLKNYWTKMGSQELPGIDTFAKSIVDKMDQCKVHTTIPLHAQMVAEYFLDNYLKEDMELPSDFSRHLLYTNIIQRKYDANKGSEENFIAKYNEIHGKLAMELLCPKIIPQYNLEESEMNIINAIGIATASSEETKICFVHKTYAEYFVAQFIFNKLNDDVDCDILYLLVQTIMAHYEFTEVKKFLNSFLYGTNFSEIFLIKLRDATLKYIKSTSVQYSYRMSITAYDNENILKMIYGAIKLLKPEDLADYRSFFPQVLDHVGDFKDDPAFLEKVIEENSEVMQYKFHNYNLQSVLGLDSVRVLDSFLKELEKQIEAKEIGSFLTTSYKYSKVSCLFYMKSNCFNNFLNFAKKHITPIDEFKRFILMQNDYWHTFIYAHSKELLLWFKENVDTEFHNLIIKLKDSPTKSESCEDRFNYYYKVVIDSKVLEEVKLTQDMLIKSCELLKYDLMPAGILLDRMIIIHSQCLEKQEHLEVFQLDKDEIFKITKRIQHADKNFIIKIIKFVLNAYYSDMPDHEANLLEVDKLVNSVYENEFSCQYKLISSFNSMMWKMDAEKYGED